MTEAIPLTADYVVVGSGAGGGPLAVRLAQAGHSVIVLEAGEQHEGLAYEVPAFHGYATEDAQMRWDFFVHHYDDPAQQARDPKYVAERGGVLYPRCATVGGCTAHNAMITVYPNDQDWDSIAEHCGDPSWRASVMRTYFQRLEHCGYRRDGRRLPRSRWLAWLLHAIPFLRRWSAAPGHGFSGWLPTSIADPKLLAGDSQLIEVVVSAAEQELAATLGRALQAPERLDGWLDPNDADVQGHSMLGLWLIPLAVGMGRRAGTREPLREAEQAAGSTLRILTGSLATGLTFDSDGRCTGVRYRAGAHLYRADPLATDSAADPEHRVMARREVILAAGAFNTPQLLMLSGIGPADELRRHGIEVRMDLPGVGANLQDRYEVTVVTKMPESFRLITGGAFHPPRPGEPADPYLVQWRKGKGPYTTNGAVLAIISKSSVARTTPDLFLFAVPADFRGYFPGYAEDLELAPDRLSWVVLKAHTNNRAGQVLLRSADPLDPPDIRFHYFGEGSDAAQDDLTAVAEGVRLARRLAARLGSWGASEVHPGPAVDSDAEIRQFVQDNAWGHHACGTCAMGPDSDRQAVLDSRLRVRGVRGLRVVDASVFPRIPGYFIVTSIYMVSEKAAELILGDANRDTTLAEWPTRAAM